MNEKAKKSVLEGVHCIVENDELIGIVRRDPISKKHLVYLVREASSDDIAELITGDKPLKLSTGK